MKILFFLLMSFFQIISNYENDHKSQYNSIIKIEDKLCLLLKLGDINNKMVFEIDIQGNLSYVTSRIFPRDYYKNSKSFGYIHIKSLNDKTASEHLMDYIYFNDNGIIVKDFHFYFIFNDNIQYNSISFAYETKNDRYSLINLLKKENYIDKLQMTLEVVDQYGSIFVGSFQRDSLSKLRKASCSIDNNKWGCYVNQIYLNKKSLLDIPLYATLTTKTSKLLVPQKVYDYFSKEVLDKLIKEKICYKDKEQYICYKKGMAMTPNITLSIGDFFFELSYKDYFIKNENRFRCVIESNPDENSIQLGTTFLSKYVEIFDYENSLIEFYAKDEYSLKTKEEFSLKDFRYLYIILIINIITLTINTIILIGVKLLN